MRIDGCVYALLCERVWGTCYSYSYSLSMPCVRCYSLSRSCVRCCSRYSLSRSCVRCYSRYSLNRSCVRDSSSCSRRI